MINIGRKHMSVSRVHMSTENVIFNVVVSCRATREDRLRLETSCTYHLARAFEISEIKHRNGVKSSKWDRFKHKRRNRVWAVCSCFHACSCFYWLYPCRCRSSLCVGTLGCIVLPDLPHHTLLAYIQLMHTTKDNSEQGVQPAIYLIFSL